MKVLELKDNERFYTVREAAQKLGVTRGRVLQLICWNEIDSIKVGAIRLISERAIDGYARTKRKPGRPKTNA